MKLNITFLSPIYIDLRVALYLIFDSNKIEAVRDRNTVHSTDCPDNIPIVPLMIENNLYFDNVRCILYECTTIRFKSLFEWSPRTLM